MPKLYTVKALAELFDKDDDTIRVWIREGVFPNAFKIKDGWYVPVSDIKKMMKKKNDQDDTVEQKQPRAPRQSSGFVNRWR